MASFLAWHAGKGHTLEGNRTVALFAPFFLLLYFVQFRFKFDPCGRVL